MFTNTIAIIIVKSFTMIFRLFCVFILAKISPKDFFGSLSFAISIAEILKVLGDLGVDTFSLRELSIAKTLKHKSLLLVNFSAIKIFSGLTISICFLMQSILSNQHDFLISILTLILTWTALLVNLPINFFHSSSETKKLLLPLSSIFVLSTTIVGILWFSQVNFIIITACLPLYEILSLAVLFTFLRKEIILKVTYFNINISKDIFRKSSWVAITMILATIYTRLDTIALNYWSNKVEMANYGVAYRLTEPFMFIGAAFSVSVYSQMSRMLSIESSRKKVLTATTKNVFLTLSYAMLAFTASYFLTPFAIHLFLKEYVVSIPVVRILSVAIIFRIINNSLTGIIQAHGYFTIITFVAAANVAISCLMIIIFSSIINATSIAVILCITEGFNTLVQLLILRTSVRNNLLS